MLLLFVLATVLGGLGGAVGSVLGNAFGRTGLFVGGLLGGLALSVLAARIAITRGWVSRERFAYTAVGAALGFLLAASIAVNTLSSPVGPLTSPLVIGLGAIAGAVYGRAGGARTDGSGDAPPS
jgi:hypothetical protein